MSPRVRDNCDYEVGHCYAECVLDEVIAKFNLEASMVRVVVVVRFC